MAAAKGMLPLSREEMIQALVCLSDDPDEGVREAATGTLKDLDPAEFTQLAHDESAPSEVLGFLAMRPDAPRELVEAIVFNRSTPNQALAHLAYRSSVPEIIEAISIKQQNLISCPDIIEAILANPNRTPEAERRAREVQQEFFEKQYGAKIVAEEQRARQQAEPQAAPSVFVESIEDLVGLGLIDENIDPLIADDYIMELGPVVDEEADIPIPVLDLDRLNDEVASEELKLSSDRLPIFQQIALLSVKDRVMLAIRGTREARMILVRDPNRIVAGAVLKNPRLTDQEIENISSMKSVPDEVLRQIGQNRAWTKSYSVVHNLVRNPRTPIAISLGFLNRIQSRDLRQLGNNKNVPDVIRTTSSRMYVKRTGG